MNAVKDIIYTYTKGMYHTHFTWHDFTSDDIKLTYETQIAKLPKNDSKSSEKISKHFENNIISLHEHREKIIQVNRKTSQAGGKENLFLSTYPKKWLDHYYDHNYQIFDPVLKKAQTELTAFRWGEEFYLKNFEIETKKEQKTVMNEAKHYGIYKGITVPILGLNRKQSAITMTFDKNANINDSRFFAISWHLNNLGHMCNLLRDFYAGKRHLTQNQLDDIFKHIEDSHDSSVSLIW